MTAIKIKCSFLFEVFYGLQMKKKEEKKRRLSLVVRETLGANEGRCNYGDYVMFDNLCEMSQ